MGEQHPGTVGGAVYGNAGAHGGYRVKVAERPGHTRENGTNALAIRRWISNIAPAYSNAKGPDAVILEATFIGKPVPAEENLALLQELTEKRRKTQPVGPSFGSTFKNPAGTFAGKLLEEAGMKGVSCGNASISTVHANFIVNNGGACAQDYYCLIRQGQKRVKEQFGVELSLEVELLGEFQDVE